MNVASVGLRDPLLLAKQIVDMPAFVSAHASQPPQAFVDSLYASAFNRAPDAAGEAYWISALSRGEAREQMLVDFAMSAETQKLVATDVASGFWLG